MLRFAISLLVAFYLGFVQSKGFERREYDLGVTHATYEYIFEEAHTGRCQFVVAKALVRDRRLKSDFDVVVDRQPLPHPTVGSSTEDAQPSQLVHIRGKNPQSIWRKALHLCHSSIDTLKYQKLHQFRLSSPSILVQDYVELSLEEPPIPDPVPPPQIPLPVPPPPPPPMTIFPIVLSNVINRVDIFIFSDGYTATEETKFMADAQRLALDLVTNDTMATVAPLINIWGAFSASNESGIGKNGKPKDTVFGLYRDGTELRGVYTSKPIVGITACMYTSCVFPILLGNDALYGGLGGMFTITTSSRENGALVLRHELGHSIIPVGEEYDGGFSYFGVNAQDNLDDGIKWNHWLPEEKLVRAERSVMPLQDYPWTLLQHDKAYTILFNSSGSYSRHLVRFSLSGFRSKHDLIVSLDGEDLKWEPKEGLDVDRWHYDVHRNRSLTEGEHVLSFALQDSGDESIAQLCSYEILEFGNEKEFNTTAGNIGAYPTYSLNNVTSYRPTNEDCLMRIVTSPGFCAPCKEGLWKSLFTRVSHIDSLWFECHEPDEHVDEPYLSFEIGLLPLGQFAENSTGSMPRPEGEAYATRWSIDGSSVPAFDNQTTLLIPDSQLSDNESKLFAMAFALHTPEVRIDPEQLLRGNFGFYLFGTCKDDTVRVVDYYEQN